MRNKLVYSCSIKICASGFNELMKSTSCLLLVVEVFFLQKVLEMLEEVVVVWWEVRWIWWRRQNFVAQFIQLLKCCATCDWMLWKRIGPFCWPIPAAGIAVFGASHQFAEHAESYSGSDRQQTTRQWPWPFSGAALALGSDLELLRPATELVVASCHIKWQLFFNDTFRRMSQSDREMVCCWRRAREDDTSKRWLFFFDFWSAHKAPTYWVFSPFQFASNAERL